MESLITTFLKQVCISVDSKCSPTFPRLLLLTGSLGSRLGHLTLSIQLIDRLDHTDSDSLSRVTNSESPERSVRSEWLDAHRLARLELDNGGITALDLSRSLLGNLTGSSIDLLLQLVESASNMRGMAIEHRRVTLLDFTGVVEYNDLSVKGYSLLGGVVLAVRTHVATSDVL